MDGPLLGVDQYHYIEDKINSHKMHRLLLGLEKQYETMAEVIMFQKDPYLPHSFKICSASGQAFLPLPYTSHSHQTPY